MARYPALAPLNPAIPAEDGLVLRGHLVYPHHKVGSSYPLAVLAHQYPATRDSFAPLCTDLLAMGVATLAFDMRGHGQSIWSPSGLMAAPTPAEPTMEAFGAAFMASAKKVGFAHVADDIVRVAAWGQAQNFIDPKRLLLVGASLGGTGVLLAASRLRSSLRGIMTFGAAGAGVHSPDAMERIRANCESLSLPMLLLTSAQDPFDGANNVRVWGKGLKHVKSVVVPGAEHAMAIYYTVRPQVLAFARSAVGVRTVARSRAKRKRS
jgi:pimeloyl-ACP methyl ester carboxylesterase